MIGWLGAVGACGAVMTVGLLSGRNRDEALSLLLFLGGIGTALQGLWDFARFLRTEEPTG